MPKASGMLELKILNRVAQALMEAKGLKEVKSLRDKAEAARQYARSSAMSQQIQNYAAELKLRAERRAGELLDDLVPHGGKRSSGSQDGNLTLEELGINPNQSARWRREAAVPEALFEQYVAIANELGRDITTQGLLRLQRITEEGKSPRRSNSEFAQRKRDRNGAVTGRFRNEGRSHQTPLFGGDSGDGSTIEALNELANHCDLLAGILKPVCTGGAVALQLSELRLVARLVSEIRDLVRQLINGKPK